MSGRDPEPPQTEALTLTDFLLARLAEDEEIARHATSGPWRYDPLKMNSVDGEESVFAGPAGAAAICVASTGPESGQSMIDARHIACHDPARVLADVAAKRAIVEHYRSSGEWTTGGPEAVAHFAGFRAAMEFALGKLAQPYADHPDFREDWRA